MSFSVEQFGGQREQQCDMETAAAVAVCAGRHGLAGTGEWSVIYRGTNTVLTNAGAQLCARIGPSYETVSEAVDTLNIVRMLVDCGVVRAARSETRTGAARRGTACHFLEVGHACYRT